MVTFIGDNDTAHGEVTFVIACCLTGITMFALGAISVRIFETFIKLGIEPIHDNRLVQSWPLDASQWRTRRWCRLLDWLFNFLHSVKKRHFTIFNNFYRDGRSTGFA
jgi:hypothetical protein